VLRAVAWEPDARCLGVGRDELTYWDGKSWYRVPTPEALPRSHGDLGLHFALRLAAGHFLLGGTGGVLVELSDSGWGTVGPSGDPRLVFEHAAGTTEQTLVISASLAGAPFLYVCVQGQWRPALQVPYAAAINGVAQLDDNQFVLVGRSQAGGAFVSIYDVNAHRLTPFLASMRPLLAVASDLEGCAYAVGPGGLAVSIRSDKEQGTALALEQVMTERDLSAVAIDPTGVAWAVAQGRVLKRMALDQATPKWETVHSYDWLVPVVGIVAAGGGISACTVDGAVLEGRDERIEVGSLAPPNPTG